VDGADRWAAAVVSAGVAGGAEVVGGAVVTERERPADLRAVIPRSRKKSTRIGCFSFVIMLDAALGSMPGGT
jgi:hypothetical protein